MDLYAPPFHLPMADIERCREGAVRVLKMCASPIGMKASAHLSGYPQIWARDSMITLLGACIAGDEEIMQALRASIIILTEKQTTLGCIPNNVDVATQVPNFQAYADAGLWFVIGNAVLYKQTGDKEFLARQYAALQRTLRWYEHQDVDQSGLITMAEASDWQDLLAVRDKGLYVNMLYVLALDNAAWIAQELADTEQGTRYAEHSLMVQRQLNEHFWYDGTVRAVKFWFGTQPVIDAHTLPMKTILVQDHYYLPYLTFRNFGEWFDTFGHLLAILSGTAGERAPEILEFMERHGLAHPYPVKAIHPPLEPGNKDWREYYRFANLNLPHQYHNGGIWPFLGGFYVAALVCAKQFDRAQQMLELLAALNEESFHEWALGTTGELRGMAEQAWSAGMYLYAYECVRQRRALFFSG